LGLSALERNGIRVNKNPPEVKIEKKLKGGLIVKTNIKQEFDKETAKDVASEMGIKNAEIQIRQKITLEELIDVLAKNRVYIPAISVLNKADTINPQFTNDNNQSAIVNFQKDTLLISAETGRGLEKFKELVWEKLGLARIYLVKKNEEPGERNPIIVKEGGSLKELTDKLGEDFSESHNRAKIWGPGAKFPGQEVSLSAKIRHGMMVRFI